MPDSLESWIAVQDGLITRQQALAFLSDAAIQRRLGRRWQVVLPGVYKADRSPLSEIQRVRAALLYAGSDAMLNDTSALRVHGLPYVPDEAAVRVLIPDSVQRASRQFVVIKRTWRLPTSVVVGGLPTAPLDRALCEFAARHDSERDSLAVLAAAVQQRQVRLGSLIEEAHAGQARGRPRLLRVLMPIEAGVRSAPEADFRALVARSRLLPTPLWNCLIELPDGTVFSPDALFEDAALIHEVNGRQFHAADEAGEDVFEAMQRRHDLLVAAGVTALHNSPRRLRRDADSVLREVEEVYLRRAGRGMPPGVKILRTAPLA
ncbi:MAG TPA: hypothetical protein VHA79_05415 [Mycobacteriales bacterium]|jgi:hypothetical protein|nr:hypothetical protein [Mycobacteriales bacterium]